MLFSICLELYLSNILIYFPTAQPGGKVNANISVAIQINCFRIKIIFRINYVD